MEKRETRVKNVYFDGYLDAEEFKGQMNYIQMKIKSITKEMNKQIDTNVKITNDMDITMYSTIQEINKRKSSNYYSSSEELWKIYPNKKSKKNALRYYKSSRKKGTTYEEVLNGLNAYIDYITVERIDAKYIKHGSTWFNQECWNDDYLVRRKKTLKDISMAEIEEAIRKEQEAMLYN